MCGSVLQCIVRWQRIRHRQHDPAETPLIPLQCVAVCCSVLQCVAVCCSVFLGGKGLGAVSTTQQRILNTIAVCRSALQCVAVCYSVSLGGKGLGAVSTTQQKILNTIVVCCSVLQCIAVCCSVLQCVAVCCSVLQCVTVCCSVFLGGKGLSAVSTTHQRIFDTLRPKKLEKTVNPHTQKKKRSQYHTWGGVAPN